MKLPAIPSAAAATLLFGLAVLAVSVETQERARGPLRLAATDLRELRAADRALVQMERSGELKLREREPDTMMPGRVHERLDQYYRGIPVFGADVVRQTDGQVTLSVFGALESGISVETIPRIELEEALEAFAREVGRQPSPQASTTLMVLPRADRTYALVYRVTDFTGTELPVVFVNATTGVVEDRYDNLQTQSAAVGQGRGVLGDLKKVSAASMSGTFVASDEMRPPMLRTYDLRGNYTRAYWILNGLLPTTWGDVAADSDNDWRDPAVVDAHVYLGWVYDYYFKRFGRRGLDSADGPIRAIVHAVRRQDLDDITRSVYEDFVANAFWCGTCGADKRGFMVFGEGLPAGYYDVSSGQHFDFLSGSLDVVAHELSHAVTTHTSGLVYRNESGALSEAFSDVMGTAAEFYFQPPGSGPMKADYLVAEDTITAMVPGTRTAIRSLANPGIFKDPDHYSRRHTGREDNGGVHANGLIGGHAFYLAIEGGTNRTSGRRVEGVGAANREQIEKVFYRAFVYYLTSSATYHSARVATIRAAQELYGSGSAAERAVTQAWDAVGVL